MYLMYVDESGDSGLENSPTRFFILSAIVIHELRWKQTLTNLVAFRRDIRDKKGLKLREEIHCNEFINRRDLFGGSGRNLKLEYIIEDPVFRDSKNSLIHQMNDVVAYCCRQMFEPNNYMKRKGGHRFYKRLENVLINKVSRSGDGIVRI